MNYEVIQPGPALARHVRCFWLLTGPAAAPGAPAPPPERILPDGCCEVVLNLADPFREIREVDGAALRQPTLLLVGPMERHLTIAPTGDVDLIGIRFEPAGLHALVGLSMADVSARTVDVGAVSGRLARDLEEAALRARDSTARVAALEQTLLRRLDATAAVLPGATEAAVQRILSAGGLVRIPDLCTGLGLGERQLERRFRDEVGLNPKLLARIVRFQRIFELVESLAARGARADWVSIALACGYADQAHLVRDFGRFAGVSPAAYFADRHDLSDFFTGASATASGMSDSSKTEPRASG